jgi:hypothetical protein
MPQTGEAASMPDAEPLIAVVVDMRRVRMPKLFNCAISPEQVLAAQRLAADTDLRYWPGRTKRENVSEEVIGLGSYGKTLTMLSSTRIGAEEETEDEEEERLIESWTPRFRR